MPQKYKIDRDQSRKKVRDVVYNLILPVFGEEFTKSLMTKEATDIWVKAFTHESVDRNNNYEELEYLGDRVLYVVFTTYLMKKFPTVDKSQLTELSTVYLGKMWQRKVAFEMGLTDGLITNTGKESIPSLATDLFESFFGALKTVGDIIVDGLGDSLCFNFALPLFEKANISIEEGRGAPKTNTEQIFTRFGLEKPGKEIIENDSGVSITVSLEDEAMKFLKDHGIKIKSKSIGRGSGETKKEAEVNAYNDALNNLIHLGVTVSWAQKLKRELDLQDPEIEKMLPDLNKKLKADGFKFVSFEFSRKGTNVNTLSGQLVGYKNDKGDRGEVLETLISNSKAQDAKRLARVQLVRNYISQ